MYCSKAATGGWLIDAARRAARQAGRQHVVRRARRRRTGSLSGPLSTISAEICPFSSRIERARTVSVSPVIAQDPTMTRIAPTIWPTRMTVAWLSRAMAGTRSDSKARSRSSLDIAGDAERDEVVGQDDRRRFAQPVAARVASFAVERHHDDGRAAAVARDLCAAAAGAQRHSRHRDEAPSRTPPHGVGAT